MRLASFQRMNDVSKDHASSPPESDSCAAACAAWTDAGMPNSVHAAAAARFRKSLALARSLIAATAASAETAAALGRLAAEIDVVVDARDHRIGIDLHRRARKNIALPGFHARASRQERRARGQSQKQRNPSP